MYIQYRNKLINHNNTYIYIYSLLGQSLSGNMQLRHAAHGRKEHAAVTTITNKQVTIIVVVVVVVVVVVEVMIVIAIVIVIVTMLIVLRVTTICRPSWIPFGDHPLNM